MINLELRVEKDEQLRNYVKELVRGQLQSISRDELVDIIVETLNTPKSPIHSALRRIDLDKEVRIAVEKIVEKNVTHKYRCSDKVSPSIILQKAIDVEVKRRVDEVLELEKLENHVKYRVEKEVRSYIANAENLIKILEKKRQSLY